MSDKKCLHCNKVFSTKFSRKTTCSQGCRKAHTKTLPCRTHPGQCKRCGKEFVATNKKIKHCSVACSKPKGKAHPAYKHGHRAEGKRFPRHNEAEYKKVSTKIREKMMDGGYMYCQVCSRSGLGRYDTHHIVYRSEAPRHENLHNERNLVICCVPCHNWFHKKKENRARIVQDRRLWELFPNKIHNGEHKLDRDTIYSKNIIKSDTESGDLGCELSA